MNRKDAPVFAFCHLCKTGGITFNQILRREFGLQHLDAITRYPNGEIVYRQQDLEKDLWIYPNLESIAGHGVRPFLDYGDFAERMKWLTILRDPSERYVSHFIHHVEHFNYSEPFDVWIDIEKHHNDQTVTIAGKPDLAKAKEILRSFFWVGFTEDYIQSMKILEAKTGHKVATTFNKRSNVAKGIKFDKKKLLRDFAEPIKERNQLDQELYEFGRAEIWPKQLEWLEENSNSGTVAEPKSLGVWPSRLKRNLIYKPYLVFNRLIGRAG